MTTNRHTWSLFLQSQVRPWAWEIFGSSPYTAGSNSGGAFVLIYLVAIVLFSLPILIAELVIGRQCQAEVPFTAVRTYLVASATSPLDREILSNETVILNN